MEEFKVKISIIVPVYNAESYLKQCLDSIQNQSYKNLEVILVDDGSTDASAAICQYYAQADERFLFVQQKNEGASAARNRGLECATGEYIGFVDADDWIEADMYETLLFIAQKEGADVVCCAYRHIKKNTVVDHADDAYHVFYGKEMFQAYISGKNGCLMSPAVWNRLFRREMFKNIRFTEGRMFEDKEISCKTLSHIKKGVYYNHTFYNYRDNEKSVSNSKVTEKYVSDFIYMYRVQEKYVNRYLNKSLQVKNIGVYYMLLLDMYCRIFKEKTLKHARKKIAGELHRCLPLAKGYIVRENIPKRDKKELLLAGRYPQVYYLILQAEKLLEKGRRKIGIDLNRCVAKIRIRGVAGKRVRT